jgi:hypothetical protein
MTFTRFHIAPRPGAAAGDYRLLVGAYAAEPLTDAAGNNRTEIGKLGVKAASFAPVTEHPLYRRLVSDRGRRLVGYDWDGTLPYRSRLYLHWQTQEGYVTESRDEGALAEEGLQLPAYYGPWGVPRTTWRLNWANWPFSLLTLLPTTHYVPFAQGIVWTGKPLPANMGQPGDSVTLEHYFASSFPLSSDLVISARLIGLQPNGVLWAWDDLQDSIPALGAIPTLKWIAGSVVRSPHRVTIDTAATPGQTLTGALTIYDAWTGRPLAILDERITAEYAWVPLGMVGLQE